MRKITSPRAFKTCYIAEVKEELGLKSRTRIAANRRGLERKVKTPKHIKKLLIKAIKLLTNETGKTPTYKQIQEKAFELYQEELKENSIVKKYYGFLKISEEDKEFVRKIVEDKELYYEGL